MRGKNYSPIIKTRREYFGGIIFRERPAFVAYVNKEYANTYQIPETEGAILCDGVFTAPLDAHFAITTRCNMFCRGCYNTKKADAQKDVSFDMAKAVIDKLSELGVFSLSFGGGEPTLHPQIFEIAAYARAKSILPNMTTNGLSMTRTFAEKCSVFGNVHFSIHKLRDMDHIFNATRDYRAATGNKPGINLLLTTETLPKLEEILDSAQKSGVKRVLLLRYKETAKNSEVHGLNTDMELNRLPARLKSLKMIHKQLMLLSDCSLFEILAEHGFSDINTYRKYDNNGCLGGNAYIAIDVNGMYKPCSFWHEPFGDILGLSFDEWINNPKLNKFRGTRKYASCFNCEYEQLCNGGCRVSKELLI
jgi:radical SAM protein with 4Fe4S-binding SPASM domain